MHSGLCWLRVSAAAAALSLQPSSSSSTQATRRHHRRRLQPRHMISPVQPFGITTIRPVPCLCIASKVHGHIVPYYYKNNSCRTPIVMLGLVVFCAVLLDLLLRLGAGFVLVLTVWLGLP